MAVAPTPVRELGTKQPDGSVLLRDVELGYRDGGEEEVLRIIREADDLSSASDELIGQASGWAQIYHLHPSRANIVRCLDLPADARVLEIGAGCGAVTRYLGETCAIVDALEPVPVRASAARARTRDLPNVEVFVGELADIPEQAAYDVIVVVGVLEYVGAGSASREPYLEFLSGICSRLVRGGTLILAIENQLGVKYLAGAPEDHSNRLFDSLEDYPAASPARTFSRRRLGALLVDAGLTPSFRVAFPDYKLTRAVLGEFPRSVRSLLHRIPQFPSPDWMGQRPRLADEHSLWRTLVEAGLETDTGNSFLVLATKSAGPDLWPQGLAAAFYSVGRRAAYAACTLVEVDGASVLFRRRRIGRPVLGGGERFQLVESTRAYSAGQDLLALVATDRNADIAGLLGQWLAVLDAATKEDGTVGLDLVPHNLVVDEHGTIHPIDIELHSSILRDQVVRRGAYWMAFRVAPLCASDRWPGVASVGELARLVGGFAGLDPAGGWLELAIDEEAVVQSEIHFPAGAATPVDQQIAQHRLALRAALDRRLADMPLGERPTGIMLTERHRLAEELDAANARTAGLEDQLEAMQLELSDRSSRLTSLEESRLVRLGTRFHITVGRVLPEGTLRRALYHRATRAQR
jgi:SAM-dependent methyltransferase